MPYIKPQSRETLDPIIDQLSSAIATLHTGIVASNYAGNLNYAITRLAMQVVQKLCVGDLRYHTIATLTGIFANVSQEFYRRIAAPYEDKAAILNGDVPEYLAPPGTGGR